MKLEGEISLLICKGENPYLNAVHFVSILWENNKFLRNTEGTIFLFLFPLKENKPQEHRPANADPKNGLICNSRKRYRAVMPMAFNIFIFI